ncbi:hypothetical protein [Leeuwenhoekiella sp. CH_XMU1409-2]|uniref:hypothetical protein n=1 Tax=Leeuwenhoekiella sp. CH_XMU1409-2 TaxID=3107768 RepID=UPI00300B3A02
MKKRYYSIVSIGILAGCFYAAVMAASDYVEDQEFSLWKFIFNFLVFGGFMTLTTWYTLKNADKKQHE